MEDVYSNTMYSGMVLYGNMEVGKYDCKGVMSEMLIGTLLFLVSYCLSAKTVAFWYVGMTSFPGNLKSVVGKVFHPEVGTNGFLYDTEMQILISNLGVSS